MHTVVLTPTFLRDCKTAGVSEPELQDIVATVAANPRGGDLIRGTGGARKLRFGASGKGKSGGYRLITYFADEDVPVFLLALVSKGQRADISQDERNELRRVLRTIAGEYRAGMRNRFPGGAV